MSRRSRRGARTGVGKASIDMNSLIDLTFLPRAKTDLLPNKNNKANTITLDVNHKLFLNDVPTTLDELENTLKEKVALDPDVPVLVRGDERLEYGEVMDVVKVVYKCQVRKMALVTVEK